MNSLTNNNFRCMPQPRPRTWPEPGMWPPEPPRAGGWPPNEPGIWPPQPPRGGIWPPNEPGIWPPNDEPGIWPPNDEPRGGCPEPGVWPPRISPGGWQPGEGPDAWDGPKYELCENQDGYAGRTFFSHGEIGIITPEMVRRMRAGGGQQE